MNINIREYRQSDLEFISESLEKMHDYLIKMDPIKRLRREPGYSEHFTRELLKDVHERDGKIFVAEKDNQRIGFIAGFVNKQSKENLLEIVPTRLGMISDIFVEEDYRNKSIGSLLLQKMEDYLKSKACDSIWVNIVAFNTIAHSFYKKFGYSDRELGLIKKL